MADRIVAAQAEYLFALKENQGTLYEDVKTSFEDFDSTHADPNVRQHTTFEVDHGRLEKRFHGITGDVSWLVERHPLWKSIKSIGVIDATRERGDKISHERRLYVSSLPPDPEVFATSSRAHWGIENSLHYVLDVAFREDIALPHKKCYRKETMPQNKNLTHLCLSGEGTGGHDGVYDER
ncbi:MAG: ISAs1 family transposase, partial [Treponema sp.]|nr:ISAs1 family transposase [Treponema sp.]